nr:reverse transcriptase domain-containing protein [Tanacetum cinerariifolium]
MYYVFSTAQKEEARIQLQAEEFDLMAAAADLDEIEKVNANCILMANVEGWVDGLVEEPKNQQAELVDELVIKIVKEVTEEDFKDLMREEFCLNNEMQKLETEFWCHAMVGAGHATYTDQFHELARLVPYLVTPENKKIERYIYGLALQIRRMVATTKPMTIQSAILKVRVLTSEVIRNGSLKKNTKKRGNGGEPSRNGNVRDDNKRSRTGMAFSTTTKPVRKVYTGMTSRCTNDNFYHNPEMPCRTCTNCNRLGHFAKDCWMGPRMVNPLNAKNPTTAREDQRKLART